MSVNIKEQDGSLKPIAGQAESVEIIDNLTTEDSDKALSAKQGKILKDLIDEGGSASIEYGDEDAYNEWLKTAQDGEIFVRTDDNQGSSGGSGEIYDDTERVIGTWFGKPLYRKCFVIADSISFTSDTWVYISLTMNGCKVKNSLLVDGNLSNNMIISCNIRDDGTVRLMSHRTINSNVNSILVLEYTKVGD